MAAKKMGGKGEEESESERNLIHIEEDCDTQGGKHCGDCWIILVFRHNFDIEPINNFVIDRSEKYFSI